MRVTQYIRRHHIGWIALFVALTGTAYAGTEVASHRADPQAITAKKKKLKRGPAGPAGPQGPAGSQGPKGDTGQPGSPAASINTGQVILPSQGTFFGAPNGTSAGSSAEDDGQSLIPAGAAITARDLSVSLPPGNILPSLQFGIITFRVNGANTSLTCTIPEGTSACQDSAHAVTIPPNSRVSLKILWTGGGVASQLNWEFGWRAVP